MIASLLRLRRFMESTGIWDSSMEQALLADCEERVGQTVASYLEIEPQAPESMFDYLYASLPEELSGQREWLVNHGREYTADD